MEIKNNPLVNHIHKLKYMMNDPMETGFITWSYKQQLLEAKWLLDEVLKDAPTYSGEEEWILARQTELAFTRISRSG